MNHSFERRWSRRLFFAAALLPLVVGLAICLMVVIVDPLDLRPWGLKPQFYDGNYPELVTPKLVRAVTRQHQDVILIGGSQAMGVTAAQLRQAFGVPAAFNLSYSLMEARDLAAVSAAAVRTPGLKRLIVELPFTAMEWSRPPAATGAGAIAVLQGPWYALPDFGLDIARASMTRVSAGEFATADWRQQSAAFLGQRTVLQNRPLHLQLEEAFRRVPPETFVEVPVLPCRQFAVLEQAIIPLIRAAAAQGVELDFYFPPIPSVSYPRAQLQRGSSWFQQVMSFHRCTLLAASRSGESRVHVLAADLDPQLVSDLANYKDTFHLVRPDKYDRLLDDVHTHRFELKGSDADAYVARISAMVAAEYRKRGFAP